MNLKLEIAPDLPEEIVIRAPEATEEVLHMQAEISKLLTGGTEIAVCKGNTECFLSYREILFAETAENRTWVHTAKDSFACPLRLYELEEILPRNFMRASKSGIVNTALICSLLRTPTGIGEAAFRNTEKRIFISRMYFKPIRERIEETRLKR